MKNTKILVVDDEQQIRKLLLAGLSGYGYAVNVAASGQEAIASVARHSPDIILIDTHLGSSPEGLDVCRILRQGNGAPIIMLAVNGDKKTNLAALNSGADDCISKPFDMEELEARIRAVLRRGTNGTSREVNNEIRVHDLVIDLVRRRVMLKGDEIHLTPVEYKLLCALATHPGKILLSSTLLEEIEGKSHSLNPNHRLSLIHI